MTSTTGTTAQDTTITITARDLVLGDQVRLFDGPYGWGTVVRVTRDAVWIFRVFVHIAEFEYTGGVFHYTGHEDVAIFRDSTRPMVVDRAAHERMTAPGALR